MLSSMNLDKLPLVPLFEVLKRMEPWELFQLSTLNSKFIDGISMASIDASIDIAFHVDYTKISILTGHSKKSQFLLEPLDSEMESSNIFHVAIGSENYGAVVRTEEVAIDIPADIFMKRIFLLFKNASVENVRILMTEESEDPNLNLNFPQKVEQCLRTMREFSCDSLEISNCDEMEEIPFDSWKYRNILKDLKIRENLEFNCVWKRPSAPHAMLFAPNVQFSESQIIGVEELELFVSSGAKEIFLEDNMMESKDFGKILEHWLNGELNGLEFLSVDTWDVLEINEVLGGANIGAVRKGEEDWQIARSDGAKAEVTVGERYFALEIGN